MGLDMYLYGESGHLLGSESNSEQIGYWRKHPNLHGYIVNEFASGVDECQKIYLDADSLEKIKEAISNRELPHTTGFFFGESREDSDTDSEYFLNKAMQYLRDSKPGETRKVFYQASW